jgi:hypothetical protein
MDKTRTFLLSLPIEEAVRNMRYENLPLHCTLFQYFDYSNDVLGLIRAVSSVCDYIRPFKLVSGAYDDTFGPHGGVAVYRIRNWFEPSSFHTFIWHELYERRVRIHNPEWAGLGYTPHVTIGATEFKTGSVAQIDCVNLVEKLPCGDKLVLATLSLKGR